MVSPFAVHIPLGAMSVKVNKYREKANASGRSLPNPIYAAMIEHCDDLMGVILNAIDQAGIADHTMVIFTSDNGGLVRRYDYRESVDDVVSDPSPLRGEKGTVYEGGIRVPLIVRYPVSVPAGTTTSQLAVSHDFFPTCAGLAGADLPENQTIDGVDLAPVLTNPGQPMERSPIYWHYPHYHHGRPATAMRDGEWKLIEYLDGSGEIELFHIENDIGEKKELSSEQLQRAAKMRREMNQWRRSIDASEVVANPHHDPERAGIWYSYRTGRPIDSDARKRFPATELD